MRQRRPRVMGRSCCNHHSRINTAEGKACDQCELGTIKFEIPHDVAGKAGNELPVDLVEHVKQQQEGYQTPRCAVLHCTRHIQHLIAAKDGI